MRPNPSFGGNAQNIDTVEATVASALNALGQEEWSSLVISSASDGRWHDLIWWHNKYYRVNSPNDGHGVQVPRQGSPEVPYERELFYPSQYSRFSLGAEANVAYFSNDFAINCCETIDQFSGNPNLSLDDLVQYGGDNPTPGWHGYPLNFYLSADAVILDLSSDNSLFFRIMNTSARSAIWNVVKNRDPLVKRNTQQIGVRANAAGFDGIVYSSVRAPIDAVMPDTNLVVFNKAVVRSGPPPKHSIR